MALAFRQSGIDKIFIHMKLECGFSAENIASIGNADVAYFLEGCTSDKAGLVTGDNHFVVEQLLFKFGRGDLLSINIHNADSGKVIYSEALSFHHSFFIPFFDFAQAKRYPPVLAEDYEKPEFLAVFTHVYNETDMLTVWENHYAKMIPHHHLYVIDHGSTTSSRKLLNKDTNIVVIPRGAVDHANISEFCAYFQRFLLTQYRWVIHVDSDELLIHENGVQAFLETLRATAPGSIIQPKHAYDVVHDYRSEPAIVNSAPVSMQRNTLKVSPIYKKPAIASTPTTWLMGFHDAFEQHAVVQDESLWLIHLAYADLQRSLTQDAKWKNLPQSKAAETFVPQNHRADTISGTMRRFDEFLAKDGMDTPQWMRGMF
jgi:Glycosyl transferase family 2